MVEKKCEVSAGDKTSNAALAKWLPSKDKIADLLACSDTDKISSKIRVAYQIPSVSSGKCGRSFEEAFIIENASALSSNTKSISTKTLFDGKTQQVIEADSYKIADEIPKKTDFAFDVLSLDNWEVPKYIKEGLEWLKD